jgi:hypothetical protein
MPSLQQRIDAYSTLSANLLTELRDLELLRELVRQAQVAAAARYRRPRKEARQHEPAGLGIVSDDIAA